MVRPLPPLPLLRVLFAKLEGAIRRRLYVVIGEPYRPFVEPAYVTDPRYYGLQLLSTPVSDEQFECEYRHKFKAFIRRKDAIRFAYHCNLIGVSCPVYDRVAGEWVYNAEATGKVADEIN
jgi:hypothetical protein